MVNFMLVDFPEESDSAFILDFFLGYFVTGLALVVSSVNNFDYYESFDNILFGSILLGFSLLSAVCNTLALRGVTQEDRRFLLPWLVLYPWVIVFLVVSVCHTLWVTDFHLELYQVFILIIVFGIFTCWKHVYKMFILLRSDLLHQSGEIERHMNYGTMPEQDDLPPKYEDCEELPPEYCEEEQPPVYDEATMKPGIFYSNKCDNRNRNVIFDRSYSYDNKAFQL